MPILKRVRVIKKIQEGGAWRFVSLKREGKRYVWDPRPGTYYLEWWDGGQWLREVAGGAPSRAIAAHANSSNWVATLVETPLWHRTPRRRQPRRP